MKNIKYMENIEHFMKNVPKPCSTKNAENKDKYVIEVGENSDVEDIWDNLKSQMIQAKNPAEFVLSFRKGKYSIRKPLCFDGDELAENVSLTVKGNGSILTSNAEIDSACFVPVNGKPYYVYKFKKDAKGCFPHFHFLNVNGKMIRPAYRGARRTTENRQFVTRHLRTFDFATRKETNINNQPKIYLSKELFDDVNERDFETMELHLEVQWYFDIVHIVRIDREDTIPGAGEIAAYIPEDEYRAMRAPANNNEKQFVNRIYWLENCLTFLETPGTYFYDRKGGELYYYPEEGQDVANISITYPTSDNLIILRNMKDIRIENFEFEGVDHTRLNRTGYYAGQAGATTEGILKHSAIYGENIDGFIIENCVFHDVAGDALSIRGRLRRINICKNRFVNIGGTAIRCGDFCAKHWAEEVSCENVIIENNYLDGIAWFLRESVALSVAKIKNAFICHNTIKNCSYSAISVGTHGIAEHNLRNVVIALNYITDFMTDMRDGAAIYTLGKNAEHETTDYFNYILGNVIVWSEICGDIHGRAHTSGLYNDNRSCNWMDYGNVQFINPKRQWYDMYFHYVQSDAWNIGIQDNVYVNCSSKDEVKQSKIIYHNVDAERNIYETGTVYLTSADEMTDEMKQVVDRAGANF